MSIFAEEMPKETKFITKTLSFRLSLRIIVALAILLLVARLVIFFFSRKAVKEEAMQNAGQTLESTVEHIDNILLDVEMAAGNIYWKISNHIDQRDLAEKYVRKLVECNPYINDSRIVWRTDNDTLQVSQAVWNDPEMIGGEAVTTFCLPLFKRDQQVGTMVVEVPLTLLSEIVLETKPSLNSYSVLLGSNGSYIVHPDSKKLNQNAIDVAKIEKHPSVAEVAKAMTAGETGYQRVVLQGEDCYVFYKPFERTEAPRRAMTKLGWSAGIVYPEEDLLGNYIYLLYMVLIIAIAGLLLMLFLCWNFIHHQLLPLRQLSKSAQRIADGHYDEPIAESKQHDEVGRLQNHFRQMQQSLATHMGEMEQLTNDLKERGETLQAAYDLIKGVDRMKVNFLYNMSDEMMTPVSGIKKNVKIINSHWNKLSDEEANSLVADIQLWGGQVTELLNQLIRDAEKLKENQ